MEDKRCLYCLEFKSLDCFNKDKTRKDNLYVYCKSCTSLIKKESSRSKDWFAYIKYNSQKTKSKKRGHVLPNYTLQEFKTWLFNQPNFQELYDNWVNSGYDKKLIPSPDRLNDNLPYTLNNIRLITWAENDSKEKNKQMKPVVQLDFNNNIITEFKSISEAERTLKIRHVHDVISGKRKHAGGFVWKYKNNQ